MRRSHPPKVLGSKLSRRAFIVNSLQAGVAFSLAVSLPLSGAAKTLRHDLAEGGNLELNAFVNIGTDSKVTVLIKHLEMGQGVYTGLATLVAEELDADWSQILSVSAPARAEYKNLLFGIQGTGGSTSIANAYTQMREAGAAARHMLVAAAAQHWDVAANEITIDKGIVQHADSGRSASFGTLAPLAAQQQVPDKVALKKPEQFRLIGKLNLPRKDSGKINGTAIYTQDIQLPGMLTAVVARPPRFGAVLDGVDDSAARAVPGVVDIVRLDNNAGVAVLATGFWQAKTARDALKLSWNEVAAFAKSSAELFADFHAIAEKPGLSARKDGDVTQGFARAEQVVEASYEFPYLAHAAMEPLNCVIRVDGDSAELWYGAQLQTVDQMKVAEYLGLNPEKVAINTLMAGGSFGRRASSASDYVLEAARIAKAYGKPVPIKMQWTREDDMRAGFFRPMTVNALKAGLDADGNIIAWQHRVVSQAIVKGSVFDSPDSGGIDSATVEAAITLPYGIANVSVEQHSPELPVPVLWWRSVASTHSAFAIEAFIDELAAKSGQDPLAFRLKMLAEKPRHRGVLELAAEKAGWGKPLPPGRTRGLALHESFNSYVAMVADVAIAEDGSYRLEKVTCAVDCGVAVNPDIIKAQMEGGIGFGLAPALMSEITFKNGFVEQSSFHDYQVLRIHQMPEVDVHIVPSDAPPTGVGEPGTPVVAPALANALFAAGSKPIRRLPLQPRLLL
ncbi:MAG: molybdopterin cofactor-binding domain-containing protein [Porticoccaceae bacterium]